MKKKTAHHRQHHPAKRAKSSQTQYLVIVRSWMFLVMFALMLGAGVMLGNFINQKLHELTPQVAGYQTEAR